MKAMLEVEMSKKLKAGAAGNSVSNVKMISSIEKYVEFNSSFEMQLNHWIVETYHPFTACETPSFRELCHSSNMKAPNIGVYKRFIINGVRMLKNQIKDNFTRSQCQYHKRCMGIM